MGRVSKLMQHCEQGERRIGGGADERSVKGEQNEAVEVGGETKDSQEAPGERGTRGSRLLD